MDHKATIEKLRDEKRKLSSEMHNIDQEIRQLQRQCTHESLIIRNQQELERWKYEMAYSYDSTGKRVIEKRDVSCADCGASWVEMRYTDAEWLESKEWGKQARVTK